MHSSNLLRKYEYEPYIETGSSTELFRKENQEVNIQLRGGHKSKKVSLVSDQENMQRQLETDRSNASTSLNMKGL